MPRRPATQTLNEMSLGYGFRVERVESVQPQCDGTLRHSTMFYVWIGQQRIYAGSSGWERDRQRSREIAADQSIRTLINLGYQPL